jgi:nitrate reductase NapE component
MTSIEIILMTGCVLAAFAVATVGALGFVVWLGGRPPVPPK